MFPLFTRNSNTLPDEVLLEKYRSTENLDYLGELFSRYIHLVYGVCLKYLSDREISKDAVMQVFEKIIYETLNHDIHNFKSWLYVLTKNYCLMQIRSMDSTEKRKKIWQKDQNILMESEPEMHPIDKDHEEMTIALKECIEMLKTDQKQCIELFYFCNKCYVEIANELQIDEKKVKSHLQNAKRNLKICLENKNVQEN